MGKREEKKREKEKSNRIFILSEPEWLEPSSPNSICQPCPSKKKKTSYKDSDEYFPKISTPVSQSTSNAAHNK